ncbi:TRAFAC clade GTPase domain-containing protein [Modestobacter lacusdianchii]
MDVSRALEQHIAVFGAAGSGKTVLVSSFYGATQEPQYLKNSLFHVVADDIGQGARLHRNYLGMKNSARLPAPTRFAGTSYSFSIKLRDGADAKATKSKPFDALRLVWHDYPGEWFEQDVSGPEEAQRRVDTFRSLLGSDVALLLVDAQELIDNVGEEKQYLRSLLANFRNGLLSLRDDLLEDGKPLVEFPRIWVLGLSKSDLLPEMDVYAFRDLLIEQAADDIDQLREVLAGLVEAKDALSVGEDFVLLSSAKFGADRIEVSERIGVDMILPLAAMLPFERHIRWARTKELQGKVVEVLLRGAGPLAAALVGTKSKFLGVVGQVLNIVGPSLAEAAGLSGDQLEEANAEALAKKDHLRATLTRFGMDLDRGEADRVLLRSLR